MSPFHMMFGRSAKLPIDLIFPFDKKEGVSSSNFVENLKLRFHRIYEHVCRKEQAGVNLDYYRYQARSHPAFRVNDTVYFFLGRVKRGLSKKLQR